MSALHRLKAYFGMVPADELDGYGPDYGSGYEDYPDDYPGDYRDARAPAGARRARLADYEDYGVAGAPDYGPPRQRTVRRGGWAADAPPMRGSLAMDRAAEASVGLPEPLREAAPTRQQAEDEVNPLSRIVTLHPLNYNEARPIGERYREGTPVIMNLTEMDDTDAKRLVDFAAGLAFALRGSIDKVTNKVFLISPPNVEVSAEDKRRMREGGFFNQS